MTHQELDDLFRANSERGEFAPEPGEWEEMTAMLDEDERRERRARWVSFGWMSLFVVLIGTGVYGLWSLGSTDPEPTPRMIANLTTAPGPGLEGADYTPSYNATNSAMIIKVEDASINGSVGQAPPAIQSVAPVIIKRSTEEKSTVTFNSIPTSNENIPSAGSINIQSVTNEVSTSWNAASFANTVKTSVSNTSSSLLLNEEEAAKQTSTEVNDHLAAASSNTALNEQALNEEAFTPLTKLPFNLLSLIDYNSTSLQDDPSLTVPPLVLAKAQNWSQFAFGLFLAEEITSVAMSTDVRLGTRVGAQLHYKPFAQWSVDLGVSYARKSYVAPDGEMQDVLGLFVDDVLPYQTDGTCNILEVPLTVTFLPKGHGNAGPFISGGLMSYRVLREKMEFHYDEPAPNQLPGVDTDDAVGSLFGTLHLQAGYRIVPRRGPAWRVGPYVQVPMSMVGHGKLPIYSGGVQLEVELF